MQKEPGILSAGSSLRRRLSERLLLLGPVLVLAIEVSGESGIVEIFNYGRGYGYVFLWVLVIALVYKFAFAYGIARYTLATGRTIFSGLRSIPGPRNWEVTFITAVYILEMVAYGGFILISAHFLTLLLPGNIPLPALALLILLGILLILWKGSYERFERVILGMVLLLFVGFVITISSLQIPIFEVAAGFVPSLDDHHFIDIMVLLGAVSGGLNLLLYSVWLHEKTGGKPCTTDLPEKMRAVRTDLLIGFALIAFMSFVFLATGASYREALPYHEIPGSAFAVAFHIFLTIPYIAPVFVLSSFVLLAGASLSGMDGRARAVCGILREAGGVQIPARRLYRIVLLGFAGIIIAAILVGRPENLIRSVSIIASLLFAIIGFALIYIDNRLPREQRGSRPWLAVMAVGSGIYLLVGLLEEKSLLTFGFPLMERLAVVLIVLFLFVRSDLAEAFRRRKATRNDLFWLVLIFAALSIYGTFRGFDIDGAILNFRDLAPIIAGLIGGPVAGVAAGLISAIFRYSLGGWTALPCSVATIAAGLIGGYAGLRWAGRLTVLRLLLLGFGVEALHLLVIFPLLCRDAPVGDLLEVVRTTFLPMSIVTAAGLVLYLLIEEQVSTK